MIFIVVQVTFFQQTVEFQLIWNVISRQRNIVGIPPQKVYLVSTIPVNTWQHVQFRVHYGNRYGNH